MILHDLLCEVINETVDSVVLFKDTSQVPEFFVYFLSFFWYTNEDLKISLYVCVHIKTIPWKCRIVNPNLELFAFEVCKFLEFENKFFTYLTGAYLKK